MSFRMRGRAFRAARNAATWLLIVSTASSSFVMAANTRREARKAKRNGCCPPVACQPCVVCTPCDPCKAGVITPAPSAAPSDSPAPPAPASASHLSSPPPTGAATPRAAGFEYAAPAPSRFSPPSPAANASTPQTSTRDTFREETPAASGEAEEPAAPIIVTEQAPPAPPLASPADPFAPRGREAPAKEERAAAQEPAIPPQEEDPFARSNEPAVDPSEEAPAAEPASPAPSTPRYQEYLDRYFNRKKAAPQEPPREESPITPEAPAVPSPSLDEPPILIPSKPAKEYNDPFRPTSYRSSPERSWRDSTGAARMRARFLGVDDRGMAQMQREDGRLTRIPLTSLSREDQRFIELLAIRDTVHPPQVIATRPKGK